jgi:hypothetical protein
LEHIAVLYLFYKSNPDKGGEFAIDSDRAVDSAIEIKKVLEPIAWVFFNPCSRYPSASAQKKGRMLPPIGASFNLSASF